MAYVEGAGYFRNFLTALQSYFIDVCKNQPLIISTGQDRITTKTNHHGSFRVVLDNEQNVEELYVSRPEDEQPLKMLQDYPLFFGQTNGPIDIISDVDDTIIASYTKNAFKRIKAIAFTPAEKRKPIGFTQKLFRTFEKRKARVIYISKSESNLFAMLTRIIDNNQLPNGHLILTPYLKLSQLLNPKKGRDYKLNHIRLILQSTKGKKYVLLGDDTQKDMEVYTAIVKEFPDKILKVYIRQTGKEVSSTQQKMWDALVATQTPGVYFNDTMKMDYNQEYEELINAFS